MQIAECKIITLVHYCINFELFLLCSDVSVRVNDDEYKSTMNKNEACDINFRKFKLMFVLKLGIFSVSYEMIVMIIKLHKLFEWMIFRALFIIYAVEVNILFFNEIVITGLLSSN